jgi:hypothetical protein
MPPYLWNILIAVDQLANAVFAGDPDETLSSRFAKGRTRPGWRGRFCRIMCRILDWIDPGHSDRYLEMDEGKHAVLP